MSESGTGEQAQAQAQGGVSPGGGLQPLPLSIAESLLSLIVDSEVGEPDLAQAEPAQTAKARATGRDGDRDPSEPQLTASAGSGAKAGGVSAVRGCDGDCEELRRASALKPVPASISGLLSSVCTEIESELIEDGSTPQGLDGLDHVLMTSVGRMPNVRHAHGVETVVELERGRWTVDVVVIFPDGLVRHRIDTFHTKARAEISARLIKHTAERELLGPFDV